TATMTGTNRDMTTTETPLACERNASRLRRRASWSPCCSFRYLTSCWVSRAMAMFSCSSSCTLSSVIRTAGPDSSVLIQDLAPVVDRIGRQAGTHEQLTDPGTGVVGRGTAGREAGAVAGHHVGCDVTVLGVVDTYA